MTQDLAPDPRVKPARVAAEDKDLARHRKVMEARIARYRAFDEFQTEALTKLPSLYAELSEGRFYRDYYSLCVCPGGAMGGQDQRTLQVFFGQRPFDVTFLPLAGDRVPVPFLSPRTKRAVAERGAMLQYSRTDRGQVLLVLRPAQTEFSSPRESEILLGEVRPSDLKKDAVLKRHLRWLLAYMSGTSIDGIRYRGQRWRYWVLTNCRLWREKDGGKWQPGRLFTALYWMAGGLITVGLSGGLLYFIQRVWPLPDAVTPAVQRAAARAHADHQATQEMLKRLALPPAVARPASTAVPRAIPSPRADRHGR